MTAAEQLSFVNREGRSVVLQARIGLGMQGQVYRAATGEAVKILRRPDPALLFERLEIPESAFRHPSGPIANHLWVTWPRDVVFAETTDEPVGYTMRYVPIARFGPASPPGPDDAWTTLHEVVNWEDRTASGFDVSFRWTLRVAIHLATAAVWAERSGLHALDLHPRNVALHIKTGVVSLLDPDGIAVGGRVGSVAEDLRPLELITPSSVTARPASADGVARWTLGVMVMQILLQGCHPFDGRRLGHAPGTETSPSGNVLAGWCALTDPRGGDMAWPVQPDELLTSEVSHLARRCFEEGREDPGARPKAEEWALALAQMDGALERCTASRRHFHIARPDGVCPLCASAARGLDLYPLPAARVAA